MSTLACQGCGAAIDAASPSPFRCPNAGADDGDHVVGRTLAPDVRFPLDAPGADLEPEQNPFVRFRALTHAYALARSRGMTDADYVALVRELDDAVAGVWGHGFRTTPFFRSEALSERLGLDAPGGVWVKDETGNVSGSHKARHLMGLAILGEVHLRTGITAPHAARLAIASCGNAALAAAVIARAWQQPLDVFIPDDAHPRVVESLRLFGAAVHVCARQPGVAGDPCYLAFRRAVEGGASPFCCQGPDNGLTVEGGETLAWELVEPLRRAGTALDRLFVQVGGGALASACVQGLADAARTGAPVTVPRLHAVQTRGGYPLRRAWERLAGRAAHRLGMDAGHGDAQLAAALAAPSATAVVREELARAARHRSELMWPWETPPRSLAHGILDDETYDWLAILRETLGRGGYPVVVDEDTLREAHELARSATGIDVDPTGTAGLAGLITLRDRGALAPGESVAVLLTGKTR